MRHRKAKTKVPREHGHHRAMMANMLVSLVEHGRIQTTEQKARALRQIAERSVTIATRLGDTLLKRHEDLDAEERARVVHAARMVRRATRDPIAASRILNEWAPRYLGRPGGYTRMFKLGFRRGDSAPMSLIEFVPAEMPPRAGDTSTTEPATPAKKGLFGFMKGKGKGEAEGRAP